MKKVVIVGGGIAGLTAGVLLQKAGFQVEVFEKHSIVGGQCTGWKREGYFIDNCIHWLTGTKEGSDLNQLWKEIGALGEDVPLHKKEMFYASKLDGQVLTFWRDLERTRDELLALSPGDAEAIHKLIKHVKYAEALTVPVDKPMDRMNVADYIKLGKAMKDMPKVMKAYEGMSMDDLANSFKHPLIKRSLIDYMPQGYQAYAFIVSYATVTAGNGDIPMGGSLQMALRIAKQFKAYGGTIHVGANVKSIKIGNKRAEGIQLADGSEVEADYVICACDTDHLFKNLLPSSYMPKKLQVQYTQREKYPVSSAFQVAFVVEGKYEALSGTRIFQCEPLKVGAREVGAMSTMSYDYEPTFAPEGHTVIQTNIEQTEVDVAYWEGLYGDKEAYKAKKEAIAKAICQRIVAEYPMLADKIRLLDCWTPMTYVRYCNAYKGAYMSFVTTKGAKSITTPGVIKGLDNVFLAGQWLMGPGGLPTAAATGKYAAWRIINR